MVGVGVFNHKDIYILYMFLKKLKRILKASKVWAVNFTIIKMTLSKLKIL